MQSSSRDSIPDHTFRQQQQQQPWLPTWMKIVLPLIIIVLVYLIVSNMEPAYSPPAIEDSI